MSLKQTAKIDTPHAIYRANGWEWRVLKTYKLPKSEAKDLYSRWFCAVSSPFTYGGFDYGDAYRNDVLTRAHLVAATPEFVEAYVGNDEHCIHLRRPDYQPAEFLKTTGAEEQ